MIHYENNWIQLMEIYREGIRRPVFHADSKQFEKTQELVNHFLPCLRNWLEAIVKAANFMDEDAMGVDLQDLLRVQNHVILTRRSLQQVGVMLCKFQEGTDEMRRLTSVGIVFNFEELKVHDDNKRPLENFHDVFQEFIGLHPGVELPLAREDEDDPQMSMNLLEGLNEEAPSELRRQRLLRLQSALRRRRNSSGDPSPEVLELATTLLLPQLLHSKALSFSPGYDSARSIRSVGEAVQAHLTILPNVALGEVEVLLCDILADLCDVHGHHVVPHLWRLFRAYLEDPTNWYSCLLALALLTRISSELSGRLLHTDAALCVFDVLKEVQMQLTRQREEVLAATGRMSRLHLPQVPQPGTVATPTSRTFGMDWTSPSWSTVEEAKVDKVDESFMDDHPLSVPCEMPRCSSDPPESASTPTVGSVPRSMSFEVMDLAAPLRWPMQAMQGHGISSIAGSMDLPQLSSNGPSRPSVPPLNLDAAKLVAGDAPSTTQRLKTQSSRLSRRLKMEAQRLTPNNFCSNISGATSSNPNDVFAETGRFTVTPFVGLKGTLLQKPCSKLLGPSVRPGDELAKMLGESALLADLGPLLRMKQENAVQEAVEKRSVSSSVSASGSDAQQTTASLANRIASQESLLSAFSGTPRDAQVTARRHPPFRRIRLHACLVLEGLCQCIPCGSAAFFEVPVSEIFEMLQSSFSRAGACSFSLETDPPGHQVPSQASNLQELLPAERLEKLQQLAARLCCSQRCVCGADNGRDNDACSPCTCVDDATAACLWQLLAEHARQVDIKVAKCAPMPPVHAKEEVHEASFLEQAPPSLHAGSQLDEGFGKWEWHQRLGLDMVLKMLATSLTQMLSQLKGAQRAGTAGPDVIMSLQHRLSATLRLASRYLRPTPAPRGTRLVLAHRVLSTPLAALKTYLGCGLADIDRGYNSGKPQSHATLRLWVTYLELVGILLLGVKSSGGAAGQLGHLLLVLLLDFPVPLHRKGPPLSSRPANSLQFKGLPSTPSASPEQASSAASLPSLPSGFFALCAAPLRTSPPNPPMAPLQVSSIWECIPKIFERVLNQKSDLGDSQTNKCLLLAFVEALLDFARDLNKMKQVVGAAALSPSTVEAMLQKLFEWLQFLFLPPSGLICRLASTVSMSSNLLHRVVKCERALFSVPDVCNSIFARKYSVLEYYVRRHFLAFVAMYNHGQEDPSDEAESNAACRLHAETLLAMASIRMEDNLPRRAFLQQSVLDFFVGEIELEHVTHQMHLNFMRRHNVTAVSQSLPLPFKQPPVEPKLPPAALAEPKVEAKAKAGKARPVPALSLVGLPASAQGCLALGAPPPEEVSRLDPAAEAPLIAPSAPVAPAPLLEPDSSDEDLEDPPMMQPQPMMLQPQEPPLPPMVPPVPSVLSPLPVSKIKVPALSFMGVRPSMQGCSGLGAPPPEEPGIQPEVESPFVPAVASPISPEDEGPDSSDEELQAELAELGSSSGHKAQTKPEDTDEQDDEGEMQQEPLHQVEETPKLPRDDASTSRSREETKELDSSDEEFGSEEGQAVGMLRSSQSSSVPKLSLAGLRSSLQGSALMGLPPPEEPGSEQITPSGSPLQEPTPLPQVNDQFDALCSMGVIHQNVFYFEGRQRRRIYQDLELHASVLTLILTLLLTPRGLLDPNYCDPYPSHKHRRNIPFLLSKHLNHSANRAVLPWVFQQVDQIGRVGELRLLKLLVESAMHRWMYTNMRMIGAGQFGTVMQSGVTVGSGQLQVAIKHIPKQTNIQDRCVLVDVFTEISCLDTIRFEDHLCHIYDFGVEESCYWIVMKYYATTLKKWRASLGTMKEHLSVLLAVFKQILKGVAVLHENDIIHYDLKCDNVMVEVNKKPSASPAEGSSPNPDDGSDVPWVALGDFGESRIMENAQELDMRNRGTEIIKGPEMLELDFVSRRDSKAHDRRKRVGTSKAADIWSLGCIFFELLTGRFLFEDYDIASHWACATGKSGDVVNEENEKRLGHNGHLLEYLRFLLVRDADRRPTIQMASKKFESTMEALGSGPTMASQPTSGTALARAGFNTPDSPRSIAPSLGSNSSAGARLRQSFPPDRPLTCAAVDEGESYFAQVLSNLCILEVCDEDLLCGLGALKDRFGQLSWTHVVDFRCRGAAPLPLQDMARVLRLPWTSTERPALEFLDLLPTVFDFLRHAAVLRGIVLFVDGYAKVSERNGSLKGRSMRHGGLAIGAVLALVAESYHLDIYSALSYVSSQLLVAALRPDVVRALASWQEDLRYEAWARCQNLVRVSCFCGACHWYVSQALGQTGNCNSQNYSNQGGFLSYMSWLRARYGKVQCKWLWLPKGTPVTDYNHAPFDDGIVSGPLEEQVELMDQEVIPNSRCFRCKTCQVMTHAEVVEASEVRRVLVSYDLETQAADLDEIPTEAKEQSVTCPSSLRPPLRLSNVTLAEVLTPYPSIFFRLN